MKASAQFAYSRFYALTTIPLNLTLMLLWLALIAGGIFMLASGPTGEQWLVSIVVMIAGFCLCTISWQWIRYRHALRERYTLDREGVLIEASAGTRHIAWSEFDTAEYLIIPGMMRLKAKNLDRPVFLFLDRRPTSDGQDQERNNFAQKLIQESMRGRYHRRWSL